MPILKKEGPVIGVDRLRALLTYDAESGEFRWTVDRRGSARAGDLAGAVQNHGYVSIKIDGSRYLAHRLAWLYVHGKFPDNDIDHINGCRTDNRIENLRDVTRRANIQNAHGPRSTNSHGALGVIQRKGSKKWKAQICVDGVYRFAGPFDTKDEAARAYLEMKRALHPGCTI